MRICFWESVAFYWMCGTSRTLIKKCMYNWIKDQQPKCWNFNLRSDKEFSDSLEKVHRNWLNLFASLKNENILFNFLIISLHNSFLLNVFMGKKLYPQETCPIIKLS